MRHIFETTMILPLRPAGELAYPLVRLQLVRIFAYRGRTLRTLLAGGAGR